jgi:hypothetical protein
LSAGAQWAELSRFTRVIPAEGLDLVSERAADKRLKQMGQRRMGLQIDSRNDQIVSRRLERDEIQPKKLGGGPNPDPGVGLSLGNRPGHLEMRGSDAVIPLDS